MRRIRVACLLVTAAVTMKSAWAADGEKLLFGFERDEVEKAVREQDKGNEFKALENGDFLFYLTRTPGATHDLEIEAIRPMRCVQEQVSQGKYSCKILAPLDAGWFERPTFVLPRAAALPLHYGTPQANLRNTELFNPSGWYEWVFPHDWSGYELLRVDLRLDTPQALKLMLEVEDDQVEPPVSLTYEPPETGKWATLEMDLAEAVKERGLRPGNIENFWVRMELKDLDKLAQEWEGLRKVKDKGERAKEREKRKFIAYVDNIRLSRKGTPCALPVLAGKRSTYTLALPRSYAAEELITKEWAPIFDYSSKVIPAETNMPPSAGPSEPGPIRLSKPSVIPIKAMIEAGSLEKDNPGNYNSVRLTCVSALDSRHMTVGFFLGSAGSMRANATADRPVGRAGCSAAVATTDGGATWKGVDGNDWPTGFGGNSTKSPPRLRDLFGNVMGMYPFGCSGITGAHIGNATDKIFFVRSVCTGDGWWKSPKYFMSGDPRHCHHVPSGDLVPTPSGRIWAAWATRNRRSYGHLIPSYSTSAYYSDDGGASWCGWKGPGFNGEIPCRGKKTVCAVPYRGNIAVLTDKGWTWFDGKTWSEPADTGVAVWYAIAMGEEIYLSDSTGPVKWYDGKGWNAFNAPGRTGRQGKIGVCGWKTAIFVEPNEDGKKLLCWRKKEGGEWQGPRELASEEVPITSVVVQRYGPAEFLPAAYNCGKRSDRKMKPASVPGQEPSDDARCFVHEPWIKALCVPAQE